MSENKGSEKTDVSPLTEMSKWESIQFAEKLYEAYAEIEECKRKLKSCKYTVNVFSAPVSYNPHKFWDYFWPYLLVAGLICVIAGVSTGTFQKDIRDIASYWVQFVITWGVPAIVLIIGFINCSISTEIYGRAAQPGLRGRKNGAVIKAEKEAEELNKRIDELQKSISESEKLLPLHMRSVSRMKTAVFALRTGKASNLKEAETYILNMPKKKNGHYLRPKQVTNK